MLLRIIKDILSKFMPVCEYCHKCGRISVPVFYVTDKLWFSVVGYENNGKHFCINCFDKMARQKGINILYTNFENKFNKEQ
jgi:hypothetical protein